MVCSSRSCVIIHPLSHPPRGLLSLEEQDRAVAEVEVYEVLGFYRYRSCQSDASRTRLLGAAVKALSVYSDNRPRTVSHEAAKVTANNAVPGWALSLVKLYRSMWLEGRRLA